MTTPQTVSPDEGFDNSQANGIADQDIAIDVLAESQAVPIPLSDRFGYWMASDVLTDHWNCDARSPALAELKRLSAYYPDDEAHPGDPRRFQYEESCFVAYFKGTVGIHCEMELDVEFHGEGVAFNDECLTSSQFAVLASKRSSQLRGLMANYPQSVFFLSHGDATYNSRVCLNSFTPLIERHGKHPSGWPEAVTAAFHSPYESCPKDCSGQQGAEPGDCPGLWSITDRLLGLALNE